MRVTLAVCVNADDKVALAIITFLAVALCVKTDASVAVNATLLGSL